MKFLLEKFMAVENFDELDRQSDNITPLSAELVDILMNSVLYYQMKYDGDLDPMCELF